MNHHANQKKSALTRVQKPTPALFFVPHNLDLWPQSIYKHFYVKFDVSICIDFWDNVRINRHAHRQKSSSAVGEGINCPDQKSFCLKVILQTHTHPSKCSIWTNKVAAILNIRKIAVSRPWFQRFRWNLARWLSLTLLTFRTVTNLKFKKKSWWRRRHPEISKNGHISATVWPTGTTFGMMTHICPQKRTSSWNFKLLKLQDGGRPPCWKHRKMQY